MAILSFAEAFDLVVMTLGVGYVFSGILRAPNQDPLAHRSVWKEICFAAAIAAPGVVFHELAHKIVAIFLGLEATFHASYFGLGLGIVLKLMGLGIFFIPGYVLISGAQPLQSSLSSFAGPLMNLLIALICMATLRYQKKLSHRTALALALSQKLNFFLFGFNMIPLPPFDGYKVVFGLLEALTG
ncbi:MAG TPA: M50 family metallopeptidase [Candidatus Nanoarchaeia archaeon]|nr:M50 family metallopeptidase [Candidatus Nanoarchaeia archaeon]